jgi:hypothetical protein
MAAKPTRRSQVTAGLLAITMGLGVAALAAAQLVIPPDKPVLDPVVGSAGGLAFAFMGAILLAPERRGRMKASFGALMITFIALLFDWVAFGPGERHSAAVGHGYGSQMREMSRHLLLASGAVLFNLMALWAWIRARRGAWKKPRKA